MALNPIAYTEKIVRSFLRYQISAYPFSDARLHGQMRRPVACSLDYDDFAKEHQPVRECFGPRFYDWQLAQSPEESWRECHLHARNLLGKEGYQALLDELAGKPKPAPTEKRESRKAQAHLQEDRQLYMTDMDDLPLFRQDENK
jgi:hypothetical protein